MKLETIKVTEADKSRYKQDGYWISPKIISDEQIVALRRAHDRVWSGDYDGHSFPMGNPWKPGEDPYKFRKLDNAWWINDEVKKVVTSPLIGELAADLMETDEVRLWHDQVIYKPGAGAEVSASGNVGWHQDYGYWQVSSTTNMVTVWIALQDTDLSNGGMMTVLGSHKWGLVSNSGSAFDSNMTALKELYIAEGKEWIEEPCILKAGQASFHHALTFHGSGPNHTNEPRLSVVAHLMPKEASYAGPAQRHINATLLGPRPVIGQPFKNEFFPLLYSR